MPAKKKAPAKKKPAAKKAAARRAAAAQKSTAKKTAAKKRSAVKKAAARRVRREVPPELVIDHAGSIPESILAIAQHATEEQLESRQLRKERARDQRARATDHDEVVDTGIEEPEAIRDRLSAASHPGIVVEERQRTEPADTLSLGERPLAAVDAARQAASPPARSGSVVIDVENLHVFYGAVQALRGISFRVYEGETVAIIGSNGAGKTTTLKTVSGVSELLKTVRGSITIMGERVESKPAHKIARLGVAHSPEGRKVFPNQTVRDNLMLGAFNRTDGDIERDIREMEERFPILGQRRNQPAGLMSGGEQQMLAMGRALMARPKVLLFDEPSMGLAPLIVQQIFDIIEELKREGKTILLVEQMAFQALGIADRGYVLETGEITMEGIGRSLLEDPRVKEAYLGA